MSCRPKQTELLAYFTLPVKSAKKIFIKTHLRGDEYRVNLRKEIMIMEHLYYDALELTTFELEIENYVYHFLEMDLLEPLRVKPEIDEVKKPDRRFKYQVEVI